MLIKEVTDIESVSLEYSEVTIVVHGIDQNFLLLVLGII